MAKPISFQTILEALGDKSTPFPARYLHRFSDLEPADIKTLLKIWPQVAAHRKLALLEDLEELAENDTLICFDNLARALLTDPEEGIRTKAIHLLWECEDARLAPIFLDILENDPDSGTRAAAATALGEFVYLGELEEIPAALHHKVEDRLIAVASGTSETLVRRRALEALGISSRPEVPPLIEAAYAEKKPDWRVSALFAMGRSGEARWEKQVLSNLRAPDDQVRSEAIRAAGEMGLASACPVLLDLLEDEEDIEMRREMIWTLSKIGGEGLRDRLEELLEAEADDDEADFLEEALENLALAENFSMFDMFEFEPDENLNEEEKDQ